MRIDVLGPLAVTDGGGQQRRIEGPSSRASLLLASLACSADPVARTDLITRLWPGEVGSTSRDPNLNTYLSEARRLIGSSEALRSNKGLRTVALRRTTGEHPGIATDVDVVRGLLKSESPDDWRSALDLIRGRLLGDLDREEDFPWLGTMRERLRREHIAAVQRLTEWPLSTIEPIVDGFLESPGGATLRAAVEAAEAPVGERPPSAQTDMGDAADRPTLHEGGRRTQITPPTTEVPRTRRRVAILTATGIAVIAAAVVIATVTGGSDHHGVPSNGSVVDAATGKTYPSGSSAPKPSVPSGQVEAGRILWACASSTSKPCLFDAHKTEISARRGSSVGFLLRLHNPAPPRVSLLRVSMSATPSPGTLRVSALLEWPTIRGANHALTFDFGNATTKIRVPKGVRRLVYAPGSTLLLSPAVEGGGPGKVLARLPDGIFSPGGIKLMNVGPPRGCWDCDLEYTRYVEFSARLA